MNHNRNVASRIAAVIARIAGGEAGAGVILLLAAAAALIAANSPLEHAYHTLFHAALPWSPMPLLNSLHLWVNDALMAVFFFVVGLEIKREVLDGELSTPARRRLPVVAAAAGMAIPALIYLLLAKSDPRLAAGWAIPAATDIAFAVGLLALAGKGLPPSLRLFLLTVAIVDDLGAVAIIAVFYTQGIALAWAAAALAVLAAMAAINAAKVTTGWAYVPLSVVLWFCVLHSGVHATIAGVLAAMTIPLTLDKRGDSPLLRMEHALTPWSAYLIVPLFGFANAGVALAGSGLEQVASPLPIAIAAGLFLGKQLGIFGAIALAHRTGFAPRPAGATWTQLWGLAALTGVGFTMSLFIGALAFPVDPVLVDAAKLGVLAGSGLSGLLGFAILRWSSPSAVSHGNL
ncbi:MAG: Na+/H+ antiporter NhaA [Novosphingobium sp.]